MILVIKNIYLENTNAAKARIPIIYTVEHIQSEEKIKQDVYETTVFAERLYCHLFYTECTS